jgi:hypothetical protein
MQQPFGYDPYAPPARSRGRPSVITWFRAYAAVTALLYPGFLGAWLSLAPRGDAAQGQLGVLLVVILVGLACCGFFTVAAMAPYKPWGWTVSLIAICLGLSSCMAPFAIPLLVFWMKPETKAAFRRL